MKKALLILALICISCSNQKNILYNDKYETGIPYILPAKVQQLLYKNLIKTNDSVYFMLDKLDSSNFEISLRVYKKSFLEVKWVDNTNRLLYLNGKFYPLIFEFDQIFSTQMSAKELKDSASSDGSYIAKKIHLIDENVYRVKFNIKGQIIDEDY